MWGFRVPIAWDGGADDLKDNITLDLCKHGQDLVELIEGTGPAVHHHERKNLLPNMLDGLHVNEMHIYTCNDKYRVYCQDPFSKHYLSNRKTLRIIQNVSTKNVIFSPMLFWIDYFYP